MNEWQLQGSLSIKWRQNHLMFENQEFKLICWELMFPSWKINSKKGKWNEPSIDFIFYNKEDNMFLCLELKNKIKSRKNLLSAYCQIIHRSILFKAQYIAKNIKQARIECFKNSSEERGGAATILEDIEFMGNPTVKMVIAATEFPKSYSNLLNKWNTYKLEEIQNEVKRYSNNKEFDRFIKLKSSDYNTLINQKVKVLKI